MRRSHAVFQKLDRVQRYTSLSVLLSALMTACSTGGRDRCDGLVAPTRIIRASPVALTLDVGLQGQVTASVSGACDFENQSVQWVSSDTLVASVDASGMVAAVGAGAATLTVSAFGQLALVRVPITIRPRIATRIEAQKTADTLIPAAVRTLLATVRDQIGDPINAAVVSWRSLTPALASVSATGVFTAVASGIAEIEAASPSASADTLRDTTRVVIAPAPAPPVTPPPVVPPTPAPVVPPTPPPVVPPTPPPVVPPTPPPVVPPTPPPVVPPTPPPVVPPTPPPVVPPTPPPVVPPTPPPVVPPTPPPVVPPTPPPVVPPTPPPVVPPTPPPVVPPTPPPVVPPTPPPVVPPTPPPVVPPTPPRDCNAKVAVQLATTVSGRFDSTTCQNILGYRLADQYAITTTQQQYFSLRLAPTVRSALVPLVDRSSFHGLPTADTAVTALIVMRSGTFGFLVTAPAPTSGTYTIRTELNPDPQLLCVPTHATTGVTFSTAITPSCTSRDIRLVPSLTEGQKIRITATTPGSGVTIELRNAVTGALIESKSTNGGNGRVTIEYEHDDDDPELLFLRVRGAAGVNERVSLTISR